MVFDKILNQLISHKHKANDVFSALLVEKINQHNGIRWVKINNQAVMQWYNNTTQQWVDSGTFYDLNT